ncbi:DNA double-strand break repair nuclease NurA [Caldiplasma sukawensis]
MDFYQSLKRYLIENGDFIRDSLMISEKDPIFLKLKEIVSQRYRPLEKNIRPEGEVWATDGSLHVRELYNGMKFLASRAISTNGKNSIQRSSFDLFHIEREYLPEFTKRIMEMNEHMAAADVIKNGDFKIMMMDGSLSGRLYWPNIRNEKMDRLKPLYYEELKNLLNAARENSTTIIYLSKTSETRKFLRDIITGDIDFQRAIEKRYITDHMLLRSVCERPGYTVPLESDIMEGFHEKYYTFHIIPEIGDTPMKVDFISFSEDVDEKIVCGWIMEGYSSLSVHNVWLVAADRIAKITRDEVENIINPYFDQESGLLFSETRGERRERFRY